MTREDPQNTPVNIGFDVFKSRLRVSRIKQQGGLLVRRGRANEAALCWAEAKDTSMQGGSHGDRCVRQRRAE